MEEDRSEGESEIDSDFEFDDDIKQSLNCLLNIPLEFESSSDEKEEEEEEDDEAKEVGAENPAEEMVMKCRDDVVERNLKALFAYGNNNAVIEDTGLENISDNELDGPESGECDSSDGELPDSPTLVRRVPDQGAPVNLSDVELADECTWGKEFQKVPRREVVESVDPEKQKSPKKKDKSPSKAKENNVNKIKVKKDKIKKSKIEEEDDLKTKLKVQKYLSRIEQYRLKCIEYVGKMSNKCDNSKKTEINNIKTEKKKHLTVPDKKVKVKSVVEKVSNEREISPHSSTSSKIDQLSHSSRSSKIENTSVSSKDSKKSRRSSFNKEKKSKSSKISKTRPEDKHVLQYAHYIKYLQSEREKCFEETNKKHKHKSKKKHKKRDSSSPEKVKDKFMTPHYENKVLTYDEFCKSRELSSPVKETHAKTTENSNVSANKTTPTSTTTSTKLGEHLDDDTELFVTYSDLVEQDKHIVTTTGKEDNELEEIVEKDPEMKSISVFTSVLFKTDSSGIPFLQEGRIPSPTMEARKPTAPSTHLSGPDDIYDCDDLSSISQSSLSPSRSPAPKTHNQALLNFLENQRASKDLKKQKLLSSKKSLSSKSSRSRSKSPKREGSKLKKRKLKKHSSKSRSPSPPPPKLKSPEVYKVKAISPSHLKKRWKDYPSSPDRRKEYISPPDRRKDHSSSPDRRKEYISPPDRRKDYSSSPDRRKEYYERLIKGRRRSRSRVRVSSSHSHRSRSSSEERYIHSRRHHCPSRSRSRSRTPPSIMVHSEKRRKLKEEHEKALASLRQSVHKPMSTQPLSISFTCEGDSYKPILDNYDPVGMNEDSSQSGTETSLPPLPPELPLELPPVPPAGPSAAPREDLTVVTTFTSFLPITPPNHPPPPMGYIPPDMHPYTNWLGSNMPVRDMGPTMYGPPPYYNRPSRQQFAYMNQPPPHLPYQMQHYHHPPPQCHQRFPGPPSNINFINVHQEIQNVPNIQEVQNPVVITHSLDSDNDVEILPTNDIPKPISNNKCKHNPLGQNNQTVQEAIDSVKKCLKNCDGLKNKDPRLAAVQVRSISPEKNETDTSFIDTKIHPDETKVKITLNYKPRPISSVNEVSYFEPEGGKEGSEKTLEVNDLKTKINNYSDRSCKIEGIVTKLKDSIENSSKSDDPCRNQPSNQPEDLEKKKTTGEDLYDPYIDGEENVQEAAVQEEASTSKHLETSNDKNITSTAVRELSPVSVQRINHQIDEAFAFIFSQSLERKRLTPTLDAIRAHKAEEHKKLIQPQQNELPSLAQGNENAEKRIDPYISEINVPTNKNTDTKSETHENIIEEHQPLLTRNPHEPITSPEVHHKELKNSVLSEKVKLNLNFEENLNDLHTRIDETTNSSASSENISKANKISGNKIPYSGSDLLKMTVDNESSKSPTKAINSLTKSTKELVVDNEFSKETVSEKHRSDKLMLKTLDCKVQLETENLEKKQDILENESNKQCNVQHKKETLRNPTQSPNMFKSEQKQNIDEELNSKTKDDCKTNEESNLATSQAMNTNEDRLLNSNVRNECFHLSLKNSGNKERRGIPCLSIPTKGELKRFPTPERNPPKETEVSHSKNDSSAIPKTNERKQFISKNEIEKQPFHSKTVVQSILNDFEESSSASSDFQEIRKGKEIVKEKGSLSALNKFGLKESKQFEPNTNSRAPSNDLKISKTNESTISSFAHFNEVKTTHEENNLLNCNDVKTEHVQSKKCVLNENILDNDCDKSKKPRKSIKSEINAETTCRENEIVYDRTKGKKEKPEKYLDLTTHKKDKSHGVKNEYIKKACLSTKTRSKSQKIQGSKYLEDSITFNDTACYETAKNKHKQVSEDQDLPSLLAQPSVSFDPVCNVLPKPGPLSKKSKSYISKNLPASFDLSVDHHLIQKGFRKLQVQVAKLDSSMSSPQIENSSSSEDPGMEVFEGASYYNMSSSSANDDRCVKEIGSIKNKDNRKDKSKKKVSFDMNVSEIVIKSEHFQVDDENPQNSELKNNAQREVSDCSPASVDLNVKPDVEILPINSPTDPTAVKDIVKEEVHTTAKTNKIPEQDKCDTSSYNKKIMDLLNSFRTRPLTQIQNRKCLAVTIPNEEEIPKANICELQKKIIPLKSKKKSNNHKALKGSSDNESNTLPMTLSSDRNKQETLHNPAQLNDARVCEMKRNNNTQSLEQNDSDMEDSFILDRELSDLAKGCLDSDSTAGGDDDSVLNFGIAASDESSLDNDFCSKMSPINTTKLSSPQNIKKRFTRKLKSLGVDVNVQKSKCTTVLNKQKLLNEAKDEKLLKAQEKANSNGQERRKSKRGKNPSNLPEKLIDNSSEIIETLKENEEVSAISKEVSKSSETSGFESLKVEKSQLDINIEGSSCKLSKTEILKHEISNPKSNLDTTEEEITNCKKTAASSTLMEDVANTSSIETKKRSARTLKNKCDTGEKSEGDMSCLRRVRKMKNNEKDVVFGNLNSSLNEKIKEEPVKSNNVDDETILPDVSITGRNHNVKAQEKHNVIDEKKDLGMKKNLREKKVEEKKHAINFIETKIDDEAFVSSIDISGETSTDLKCISDNFNSSETEHGQVEKVTNDISCQRVAFTKKISGTTNDSSLSQSVKLRRQHKIKFTELSNCDLGLNELINVDGVAIARNEKGLRKKIHHTDSSDTVESTSLTKGSTDMEGNKKMESGKKKISKTKVADSVLKKENLRLTRSKSQIANEKVDTVEDADSLLNHINIVITESYEFHEENSMHKKNTVSREMVKIDSNKTEDNKMPCKKIEPISRTFSTESFDEPLITLKNKLLSGENEEKCQKDSNVCNVVKEPKLVINQNNTTNNEECINKVNTFTTQSSKSNEQKNSNNCSQTEKIKENKNKTVSNTTSIPNSDQSHPDSIIASRSGKLENSDLTNESTRIENLSSNSHRDTDEYSFTSEINLTTFGNNSTMSPKVNEALRKKRDKTEVDAEIKRRLAEIDELEKLATTQHATVLEKIGARTRSKTVLKLAKPTDEVNMSHEISHHPTIHTNNTRTVFPVKSEVNDPLNETGKAAILLISTKKSQVERSNLSCMKEKSRTEKFSSNSDSLETPDSEFTLKEKNATNATRSEKINKIIDDNSFENDSKLILSDIKCKDHDEPSNDLSCSTSVTANKKVKQDGKIKLCKNVDDESGIFSKEQTRRTRRNIAVPSKLGNDDDEPVSTGNPKIPNLNKSIKEQNIDAEIEKNKISILNNSKTQFLPGSGRKTRNKSSMFEELSEKSFETSRDTSPLNPMVKRISELISSDIILEPKLNKRTLSSTITEPDSSTPTLDSSQCPVSTNMDEYENKTEELSPVESNLSDMYQEPDTVESSATSSFRTPLRKSVINKKRRGNIVNKNNLKALSHSTTQVNEINSPGCNEQDNSVSEGIVSSSVNTFQSTSGLKKKRRKRKSFVDLLMDDSMLSVTRDFPMSPNPYILPSFYKELEISSNNTQLSNNYDMAKTLDEPADTHTLPPKPDILAQKLRLLEKLKNINRKNRKTRQCRTLVCYNEDSLPESLVESPASEAVPQSSDDPISPEDLLLTKDNEREESSVIETSDSMNEDTTKNYSCKNQYKANINVGAVRKRRGKSASFSNQLQEATNSGITGNSKVTKLKDENCIQKYFEDNSNSNTSFNSDIYQNCSKSLLSMAETEYSTIDSNQTSGEQINPSKAGKASEFDQILLHTSNNVKSSITDHNMSSSFNENVSYCSSKDFCEAFTSVKKDNFCASEKGFNNSKKFHESSLPIQPNSTQEGFSSKIDAKLIQEKIVCSILKAKIGKMLPLFGDSSAEEDLDEDIPLFVKLSQTYQCSRPLLKKAKNTSATEQKINITTKNKFLAQKKRGRKPNKYFPKSYLKKQTNKFKQNSFTVFLDDQNKSASTKENEKNSNYLDSCDESIVSNPEPSRLLRKSNRIPRSFKPQIEEQSVNNIEQLSNEEASPNETASNETLCSEMFLNKTYEPKPIEKQIIPIRKRGRPPKIKHPTQTYHIEEIPKATDSEQNDLEVKISLSPEETKVYSNEDSLNTNTNERNGQVTHSVDENLISIHDFDEIGTLELTSKGPKFGQTLLGVHNNLDSVTTKPETLRQTRAKHNKLNQNKQSDDITNDVEDADNNIHYGETSVDKKPRAIEEKIVKRRWQRGKWLRRQHSATILSASNDEDIDVFEDNKSSDKEDIESLLETSLDDSPPPLVKTRSRRPRSSNLDCLDSDPPHLETPFQFSEDTTNIEKSKCAHESNMAIVIKKRGRKPKAKTDLDVHKKIIISDDHSHTSQPQEELQDSYDNDETDFKTDDKDKVSKETVERQVFTRKAGRKSKFSITQIEGPISVNSFYSNTNLENKSKVKNSICSLTKNKLLPKNEESSGTNSTDTKNNVTDCNLNKDNDVTATLRFDVDDNENKTTNFNETTKDNNNLKCCKPKLKRKKTTLLSDDPGTIETSKKIKIQDDDPEDLTTHEPSNIHHDTTSNTPTFDSCSNQSFLWNKISGFLNKTTRCVGTQVKIKNMVLKGFETSEPEVSLQSEMTLPQVIKTLFEELKTTDSSFSDI